MARTTAPRNGSAARLVIALSVASVLAVFLLYTSIAGGGTPSVSPRALAGKERHRLARREGHRAGDGRRVRRGASVQAAGYRRLAEDDGRGRVHRLGSRPVQARTAHRCQRCCAGGGVRRPARLDDHQVPVEVRGRQDRRARTCPSSAVPHSLSRSGSRCMRWSRVATPRGAAAAASRCRRETR